MPKRRTLSTAFNKKVAFVALRGDRTTSTFLFWITDKHSIMRKKTIWFINEYAGSKRHGMVYRTYYLAKEFVARGHKVHIISASFSHLYKELPEIEGDYTYETIDGIDYVWLKVQRYKNSTDKKRVLKWFSFVRKLYFLPHQELEKPDYIISSSSVPFCIMPAKRLARIYSAKLIYEVRDIWPLTLCELGGYSKRHPLILLMQWFSDYAYKNADLTVSSLSNAYEYMRTRGLLREKFKYIPNGISLEDMARNEPLSDHFKSQIPRGKFIIGYTGTMGIANSLKAFLESAIYLKKYKDIALVLVGDGRNKPDLEKIKEKNGLENVTFIDSIPKNQVQSILALFDACFIAGQNIELYKYGVSPNKLYDYLYAGKPILYAVNDENSVVDRSSCGITVDSSNPEEIATGAIKLYNMTKEKRKLMGEGGKKLVLEHHTFEKSAEAFISVLESL